MLTLSTAGATIQSDLVPAPEAPVVLYVESGFGRFEGHALPADGSESFGIEFHCTPLKRERTEEQLACFASRTASDPATPWWLDRAQVRFARFVRSDGEVVRGEIAELSISALSLKTEVRPPVGEYVLIGQLVGKIAGHRVDGIEIELAGDPAERASLDRVQSKVVLR